MTLHDPLLVSSDARCCRRGDRPAVPVSPRQGLPFLAIDRRRDLIIAAVGLAPLVAAIAAGFARSFS